MKRSSVFQTSGRVCLKDRVEKELHVLDRLLTGAGVKADGGAARDAWGVGVGPRTGIFMNGSKAAVGLLREEAAARVQYLRAETGRRQVRIIEGVVSIGILEHSDVLAYALHAVDVLAAGSDGRPVVGRPVEYPQRPLAYLFLADKPPVAGGRVERDVGRELMRGLHPELLKAGLTRQERDSASLRKAHESDPVAGDARVARQKLQGPIGVVNPASQVDPLAPGAGVAYPAAAEAVQNKSCKAHPVELIRPSRRSRRQTSTPVSEHDRRDALGSTLRELQLAPDDGRLAVFAHRQELRFGKRQAFEGDLGCVLVYLPWGRDGDIISASRQNCCHGGEELKKSNHC